MRNPVLPAVVAFCVLLVSLPSRAGVGALETTRRAAACGAAVDAFRAREKVVGDIELLEPADIKDPERRHRAAQTGIPTFDLMGASQFSTMVLWVNGAGAVPRAKVAMASAVFPECAARRAAPASRGPVGIGGAIKGD